MERNTLPERLRLVVRVRECEVIPAWYGAAWTESYRMVAVCMPIPLNVLAAICRGLWVWLRWGYRAVPCDPRDAYAQGRRDATSANLKEPQQ
jgi:hypothetical protein